MVSGIKPIAVRVGQSFERKGREVTPITCGACGKCALVYTVRVGEESMAQDLTYANFCQPAIDAAIQQTRADQIISADSV